MLVTTQENEQFRLVNVFPEIKRETFSTVILIYTRIASAENSTGSLGTCYVSFRTINFPSFLPCSFQSRTTFTPSPMNTTHEYRKPFALCSILHFTYLHQNSIKTHKIYITHLNKRLLDRS
jgi:hypothetical protein